jgi:hypothetical protein
LPAYQISSAHFSSFHFSVICTLPLELVMHMAAFVGFFGLLSEDAILLGVSTRFAP